MEMVLTLEEVRVLNGLSRGAAIPMESTLLVGCAPECDLVLLDPLVADREATLVRPVDDGGPLTVNWLTQQAAAATDGSGGADISEAAVGGTVARQANVALGDVFTVSGVLLQYCRSDAAWDYSLLPNCAAEDAIPGSDRPLSPAHRPRFSRRLLWVVIAIGVAVLLTLAALLVYMERQDIAAAQARKATVPAAPVVSLEQIADRIRAELDGRRLTMLKVRAERGVVHISGTVPLERQEEFEGVVERARSAHRRTRFRFDTAMEAPPGPAAGVAVIVGGTTPNLLLRDGRQLYLGSVVDGFRLMAIDGNCAVFKAADSSTRVTQCLVSEKTQP